MSLVLLPILCFIVYTNIYILTSVFFGLWILLCIRMWFLCLSNKNTTNNIYIYKTIKTSTKLYKNNLIFNDIIINLLYKRYKFIHGTSVSFCILFEFVYSFIGAIKVAAADLRNKAKMFSKHFDEKRFFCQDTNVSLKYISGVK